MATDRPASKHEDSLNFQELERSSDNGVEGAEDQPRLEGQSQELIDYEKRLIRKTDWHVIPILFILFLCAYIDR